MYLNLNKISGGEEIEDQTTAISPVTPKPATPLTPLEHEQPLETEEVSPVPFDPPIEDLMDGRKKSKNKEKKRKKSKKEKKDKKNKHSRSQRDRGGSEQFQPFEAGSPVSPEDFGQLAKVRLLLCLLIRDFHARVNNSCSRVFFLHQRMI